MTRRDAVAALERLGLPTYEAEVFVACRELGTATAATVSDASGVPRSQVYGAADDLAEKGLLEVVESSPKRFRAVDLEAARRELERRQRRSREAAVEALSDIEPADETDESHQAVSTLRGTHPIADRVESLVADASETVIAVAPGTAQLSEPIAAALREGAAAGVDVTMMTTAPSIRERFADSSIRVIVMPEGSPSDYAGRTVVVDEDAVLLSVVTPDEEGVGEEAMWTAGTNIARILAEFVHSGVESGMDKADHQGEGPGTVGDAHDDGEK